MTTDAVAAAYPVPVTRNLNTNAMLIRNTRNWTGASTPWTRVQGEASRRCRSSFVYRGIYTGFPDTRVPCLNPSPTVSRLSTKLYVKQT